MKTILPVSAAIAVVAVALPGLATSQAEIKTDKTPETLRPLVLSSEVMLGAEICDAADAERVLDSVSDYIVKLPSGELEFAILASGTVLDADRLSWTPTTQQYCLDARAPERSEGGMRTVSMESSGRVRFSTQLPQGASRMLASALMGSSLMGLEISDEGRKEVELGSVGGMYVDVNSHQIAFVTTSVGGVLGIGSDSKVIPWGATTPQCSEDDLQHSLHTQLTAERLENAPSYGSGAEQLHNPGYRDQLYSFFGCDKPRFETASSAEDRVQIVTLDKVLGAEARTGETTFSVTNLMVNKKDGKATVAILDDGQLVPMSALTWNAKDAGFELDPKATKVELGDRADYCLANSLNAYTVTATDGEYGSLEDIYFDTQAGELAYLTIASGGTLGLGGNVYAFPWSVVSLDQVDDNYFLRLPMTKEQAAKAPKLDGKAGSDIHSPAFRERTRKFAGSGQ